MVERVVVGAGVAAGLLSWSGAWGSVLVQEQFSYTLGAAAGGQSGGTGFFPGSAWGYSEGGGAGGSTSTGTIAAGLAFSDLPVSGNSLLLSVVSSSSSGFADTVNLRRRPAATPNGAGDEFWTRYLFREGVNRPNVDSFLAGMTIDDAETVSGYHKFGSWAISGATNDHGGVNVDSSITTPATVSGALTDSTVWLLIGKYTNVNGPSGVARVGKWWALSAADYDAIKAGGITEAQLDAVHSQFATETVTPTVSQPLNFTTNDFYDFRGSRPAVSDAFEHYYFDELYSGTSIDDLGLAPAPGTAAGVTMMGVAGLARRRRG